MGESNQVRGHQAGVSRPSHDFRKCRSANDARLPGCLQRWHGKKGTRTHAPLGDTLSARSTKRGEPRARERHSVYSPK